jgi:hypothetical protein
MGSCRDGEFSYACWGSLATGSSKKALCTMLLTATVNIMHLLFGCACAKHPSWGLGRDAWFAPVMLVVVIHHGRHVFTLGTALFAL